MDRRGFLKTLGVAGAAALAPERAHAAEGGGESPDSWGVLVDITACVGCRYCEMACPFGAPAFDEVAGVMTKCHLCHTRLDQGLLPACVVACPTHALRFSPEVDRAPRPFVAAPELPGFADPSRAGPALRLAPPRGGLRGKALNALRDLLKGKGGRHG